MPSEFLKPQHKKKPPLPPTPACQSVRLLELHAGWDSITATPCLLQAGMKTLRDGDSNPVQCGGENTLLTSQLVLSTSQALPAPLVQHFQAEFAPPLLTLLQATASPAESPSPAPAAITEWAPPLVQHSHSQALLFKKNSIHLLTGLFLTGEFAQHLQVS